MLWLLFNTLVRHFQWAHTAWRNKEVLFLATILILSLLESHNVAEPQENHICPIRHNFRKGPIILMPYCIFMKTQISLHICANWAEISWTIYRIIYLQNHLIPQRILMGRDDPQHLCLWKKLRACFVFGLFAGGWVRQMCHVSYITGASSWYWLTAGQGLLSSQQVRVERECFYFFCFLTVIHFTFSPVPLISSVNSSISLLPFSGKQRNHSIICPFIHHAFLVSKLSWYYLS